MGGMAPLRMYKQIADLALQRSRVLGFVLTSMPSGLNYRLHFTFMLRMAKGGAVKTSSMRSSGVNVAESALVLKGESLGRELLIAIDSRYFLLDDGI